MFDITARTGPTRGIVAVALSFARSEGGYTATTSSEGVAMYIGVGALVLILVIIIIIVTEMSDHGGPTN